MKIALHKNARTTPAIRAEMAANAKAFLAAFHRACPIKIQKILTDNGKEFTDRLFATRARKATGNHVFDQLCTALDIEHRLTKPRTPQTNGMVERSNGRISDVLKTNHFVDGLDLEQTLLRYVLLYNQQLPQSALKSQTPLQTMKNWYKTHSQLFHKPPHNQTGCDRTKIPTDCCANTCPRAQICQFIRKMSSMPLPCLLIRDPEQH